MSSEIDTRKLSTVLKDTNEKLDRAGVLNVRLTYDIWTKLMSFLLQGDYTAALPIRQDLQDHMRRQRYEKIHTFNSIIQRLDEILDRIIPPPDLNDRPRRNQSKTSEKTKEIRFEQEIRQTSTPDDTLQDTMDEFESQEQVTKEYTVRDEDIHVPIDPKENILKKREDRKREEEMKQELNLLKVNESVLMKTVEDQQNKIKTLEGTVQSLEKWNIALKDDILSIAGDKDDETRDDVFARAEREIKFLRKELKIKEQALEISMVERDQLLNKLSDVTSSKMKLNNKNHAAVNDIDRPTRIAEKYSDLYESEWTDSLHILTLESRFDERSAIRLLLEILLDSYSFCERTSERHIQLLIEDLLYPCKGNGEMRAVESSKLNMVPKKLLTELQRTVAPGSVTQVQAQFRESLRQSRRHVQDDRLFQRLKKYMDRCTELCWYMVVQSPPMHMDTAPHKSGDELDRDAYRFYTVSGSKVDYIVWPAVYLSRQGIVLQRGVAQAKAEGVALRISTSHTLRNM